MPMSEMPEFLLKQPEADHPALLLRCQSTGDLFDDVQYMQAEGTRSARNSVSRMERSDQLDHIVNRQGRFSLDDIAANCTSQSDDFSFSNQSFSSDGFLPTPEMADDYFQMRPVIVDANSSDAECVQKQSRKHTQHSYNVYDFHQQSLCQSGLTKNAPVASPEQYFSSPNTYRHKDRHRDEPHSDWCGDLDDTLTNSPKHSDQTLTSMSQCSPHKRLTPPPLPMPGQSAVNTSHHQNASSNPAPTVDQNRASRDEQDSKLKQVDRSQCRLNVNKYVQSVNKCSVENVEASWTKDKVSKYIKSGPSKISITPKVLTEQNENATKSVVLELSQKEELVTFV